MGADLILIYTYAYTYIYTYTYIISVMDPTALYSLFDRHWTFKVRLTLV